MVVRGPLSVVSCWWLLVDSCGLLVNVINLRTEAISVGVASSRDQSFRGNSFRGWKPLPQKDDLKLTTLGC